MVTRREGVHVVHVTTVHSKSDNRIFNKECRALRRAGFRVSLIVPSESDEEIEGVEIRALQKYGSRLERMLKGPLRVWEKLREVKPSVVHIHDPELIPVGALWRVLYRTPVVYDAHEDLAAQVRSKPYIAPWIRKPVAILGAVLERFAGVALDGVVVVLPEFASKFRGARIEVVQNYPWLTQYPEPSPSTASNHCVYVGALTEIRGVYEMLQASRDTHGMQLTLAGPVTDNKIRSKIDEAKNIEYLGIVSPDEIPSIIEKSAVGLLLFHKVPNHMRSRPNKLFEYMAAGRPFIATDMPYWKELVGEEECGLFVDVSSHEQITNALRWIRDNPESAKEMGSKGRRIFEQRFTFESQEERLVSFTEGISMNREVRSTN